MAETATAGAASATAGTDAQPTADQKAATEKAAADKVVADKAAADKATADAAAAASGGKDGADAGQPKPPDKYTLKAPDETPWFTDRDMKRIETRAREHGLTNDQAQAMLDEQMTYRDAVASEFLTETKADKEYGGDKLDASLSLVKRVIDRVRPDGHPRKASFHAFMDRSAAGNNLEVVSFLADLGKLMAEDSPSMSTSGSGVKRDHATVLYGEEKG